MGKMIFQQQELEIRSGDGGRDLSGRLQEFLQAETMEIRFRLTLWSAENCEIVSVYYKDACMPDFSVNLWKGYLTVILRSQGRGLVLYGNRGLNDGREHEITVRREPDRLVCLVDGMPDISEKEIASCWEYGYVNFVTVGRGEGDGDRPIARLRCLSIEAEAAAPPESGREREDSGKTLFYKELCGVENYRIPNLISLGNGVMIAGADARMEAPGDAPNHICRAMRLSRDWGASWEEPVLLEDGGGFGREQGDASTDGQFVYDRERGRCVHLFTFFSREQGYSIRQCGSADGGETWSDAREIPGIKKGWMKFVGIAPGLGIQLRRGAFRGRLICPFYWGDQEGMYFSGVLYSDDGGGTWSAGGPVDGCRGGECQAAELPDGALRLFVRDGSGRIASARSLDGGETWRDFRHEEIPNPDCQFSVLCGEKDPPVYYLSSPSDRTVRSAGRIWRSTDGTETWQDTGVCIPGDFGYSVLAELPGREERLGILYEGRDLSIRYEEVSPETKFDKV